MAPGLDDDHGIPGRRYRVSWDDCCSQGSFEAVLEKHLTSTDPVSGEQVLDGVVFDNGVTVSGFGTTIEEILG